MALLIHKPLIYKTKKLYRASLAVAHW